MISTSKKHLMEIWHRESDNAFEITFQNQGYVRMRESLKAKKYVRRDVVAVSEKEYAEGIASKLINEVKKKLEVEKAKKDV